MHSTSNVCPTFSLFPKNQTLVIDNGVADGPWVITEDTEGFQTRD